MASSLPIQDLMGSMRFPLRHREWGTLDAGVTLYFTKKFMSYKNRIYSSSRQYLSDANYKQVVFVSALYSFT